MTTRSRRMALVKLALSEEVEEDLEEEITAQVTSNTAPKTV
jgi:hypothetical protein